MLMERYVNPFTDFGFKKLFGTEVNKDILIDFLNELLKGKEKIKTLSYKSTEFLGITELDRKAVFDLYCENDAGEKFIVEIQKAKQRFFKDRALFYSTFPIQEQAQRGDWKFELKSVYTIAILDFIFDEDAVYKDKVVFEVKLSELEHKKVFYDKLTFICLAMPNFKKLEHELISKFDKWLYAIKNLPNLDDRPKALQERIFKKFFESAEIAKFTREEIQSYEYSLKVYRDLNNVIETALEDGYSEGFEQGIEQFIKLERLEIVKKMKNLGFTDKIISEATGLDAESIYKVSE